MAVLEVAAVNGRIGSLPDHLIIFSLFIALSAILLLYPANCILAAFGMAFDFRPYPVFSELSVMECNALTYQRLFLPINANMTIKDALQRERHWMAPCIKSYLI